MRINRPRRYVKDYRSIMIYTADSHYHCDIPRIKRYKTIQGLKNAIDRYLSTP